ncbi:MAG: hypothetical protein QOI10_1562 [Solirubrobacterales bacterium]|nr:hypothetical protein [Solirubrobacterales bacterium]
MTASLSLAHATFVLGALTFLIAGTTLYLARFRPGRVTLRHVPTHLEWARGGGTNEVPDLYRATLRLAASNPGAHPCILERLVIDRVEIDGPVELATDAALGEITGAPGTEVLAAVIDSGASEQFEFKFQLEGLVSSVANTTPTPDLVPLATALGQLKSLDLVIRGEYQRGTRGGTTVKTTRLTVPLPVERARRNAAEFWRGQNRSDLAELVDPTS